jgi:hypothetical protein
MASDTKSIPRLEKTKNSQQLIVDGKLFSSWELSYKIFYDFSSVHEHRMAKVS